MDQTPPPPKLAQRVKVSVEECLELEEPCHDGTMLLPDAHEALHVSCFGKESQKRKRVEQKEARNVSRCTRSRLRKTRVKLVADESSAALLSPTAAMASDQVGRGGLSPKSSSL